ncbi:MAG TPA: hypothetical protein VI643_06230, partial [Planctomycetota bacterium]|nr:hypothetical protein [Planctomycetota bacterium]
MVASKQREGIVRALDGVVLFLLVLQICFRVSVSSYSATVDSSVAPASHASNFLASALVFVAATVWLLRRFLTGGVTLRLSGIEAWLGIFVMASMFSMMFADYKLVAIEYVVSWGGLALLFALAMSAWGPERARLAVRLLLALGVVTVAYGIIQRVYLFGEIMRDPEAQRLLRTEAGRERLEERQVFSTFAYPNTFAAYLVAMCAVLAGLGMDAWRAGRRGWALASPVLLLSGSVVCLALTASKGGWVAGGVAAGVFVWLATRRRAVLGVL